MSRILVERELLVGARSNETYRLRWGSALAALLVWFAILIVCQDHRAAQGPLLLRCFAGMEIAFAAFAGVFLTADCISEEKRAGTLGLLFLTDLTRLDVVLGKMAARSLRAATAFFSLIPFLILPVLLGGVTLGETVRVAGALFEALFFSLAVGLFVSVVAAHSYQAAMTTLLLVLVVGGVPLFVPWAAKAFFSTARPLTWLRVATPMTALLYGRA